MAKFISIFNNKGGVGKTNIAWNLAHTLGTKGHDVLLVDFDPQCNLSLAVLGAEKLKDVISDHADPKSIRNFMQAFLLGNTPTRQCILQGRYTNNKVHLVCGDFWLNVFADSLNVGNDLLSGTGISRYVVLRKLVSTIERSNKINFGYVIIDLPPSFGNLVRAAMYSSDYFLIPCTSDPFSAYCVELISQVLPQFMNDWRDGLARFKSSNYGITEYDNFGKVRFGGWIFNGFDTRKGDIIRGDKALQASIISAVKKLYRTFHNANPNSVAPSLSGDYDIGYIEDMNVIIQNSLWQNVPIPEIINHKQVKELSSTKTDWAPTQRSLITKITGQFESLADNVVNICK